MNKRPIKSSDWSSHSGLNGNEKKKSVAINMAPVFTEEKPWQFVKVLKTTTGIIPWLVKIGDDYIVATQGWVYRRGEQAMFYKSNRRGTFNVSTDGIIVYLGYVDLEAAVDRFYEEHYPSQEETEETKNTESYEKSTNTETEKT